MPIEKINSQIGSPPILDEPHGLEKGAFGNAEEIKDPRRTDPPDRRSEGPHPLELAAFFAPKGLLDRIRKKLAMISRKRGQDTSRKNTIASVDDEDNVYVGVDFLAQYGDDENLIAGILAHEWGHMMSDLPKNVDWSKMSYDDLHAIRRDEEGDADGFAGRVMFLMGYSVESMIEFLADNDRRRKEKKLPCHKYHNHATRRAILEESYEAEKRAMEVARRLFFSGKNTTGPKIGKIIGAG